MITPNKHEIGEWGSSDEITYEYVRSEQRGPDAEKRYCPTTDEMKFEKKREVVT